MAAKRKQARTIAGDKFLPDLSGPAVAKPLRCWVGLLPECPANQADVFGMSFVKHTERIVRDPNDPSEARRVPVIGTIGFLDPASVDAFVEAMGRQIIRTTREHEDGRKLGKLIRIPSPAKIENARETGGRVRAYHPQAKDEPLARYAYLVVLDDQESGRPGDFYPDPIEKTGIEVPNLDVPDEAAAVSA